MMYPGQDDPRNILGLIERGFQNVSINVIDKGAGASKDVSRIRPCPPGFMCSDINCMNKPVTSPEINFEKAVCLGEFEAEENAEDYVSSPDLLRMVEQKDKQILPHEESVETINLGTEERKQEDMPGLDEDLVVHKLPLKPECKPIQQKLRRTRPEMLLKIKEVNKQFDAGFLQPSKYPKWMANIVPVPKKDGKVRVCVDYRDLNRASPKDNFPLPHIDTLVDNTAKYSLFSFMDGFSGYNQIKMAPEDMEKTTFITMWGTFCYKVMPFGLKNAGAIYQRAMVTLFHDMMHKEIEVYIDDMIAKSRGEEEHVVNLKKLFERLRKFQLKLNPAKCTFGATSGKFLGFIVSERGIEVDPNKIKAIQELPPPRMQKEVRGFLGRLNYIARFIAQLTNQCDPIFQLLRKLNPREWKRNASSMGCVLGQHDELGKKEKAIYYLSKKFTEYEAKYSSIEKYYCALVWVAQRLKQYMLYHTTWLISKLDPIKYMMESPALSGRMARCQVLLLEYDTAYVSQKSIKGSAIADFLATRTTEEYESLRFDFPDEDLMCITETESESSKEKSWKMCFDGVSNALGHRIGAILVSPDENHYPFTARLNFSCTNNIAEYEASLVIYQIRGEWEVRNLKLIKYSDLVAGLIKEFKEITFHYFPREENQLADALATLASMFKASKEAEIMPLKMSIYEVPAHCCSIEKEADGWPWFHDILEYIKNQSYPEQANENNKRTIRRMAAGFVLDGDILYKRGKDQVLLRCVDDVEARKILEDVHEGICGTHANGFSMARKIMRLGYYWLTMESDCISFARKFHKCQIYSDKIHVAPSPLHVMTSPWPFSMWGMDVIGPIFSKPSNRHRFIFVVIDYFTKWIEVALFANVTKTAVCRFLKKEIICRYGLPERIISDNAMNLNNKMIKEVCEQFQIKHHNSSPYRPKMNGAVEAANKNIKRIIGKMTETFKDWHEKLPFSLFAYRTSVRTSTGATPFSLVYGMEAVLPIEVEIPSLRVLMESKLEEAEWVQARYDQLNLIKEKRLRAICHGQMYQKRMIAAHDKKVRPREFHEGEFVLRKILPIQKDLRGKWAPNWEGPYVVKKAFLGGALILTEMDGKELSNLVNSDAMKKYYA
ncbi:hypothetical protein PVK06_049626 [Gossypium arboreum]|uniref:Uncharacterized protein n=1 Tax=Gossypium arboreum TaxID=29729 RepID=A0ABR0MJA4_GOSAR|nr:hypothetical protein PVK06_049626 [Gossypium arboreum]